MKKFTILLLIVLSSFFSLPGMAAAKQDSCLSEAGIKAREEMRILWTDHVFYTRNYVISAVDGLEDTDIVLARLLQNQKDIGNAIKPYYGEKAGNKLADLLTEHIVLAGKIVDSAKGGKSAQVEQLNKEWYQNADDIARLLASANPYWSEKKLKDLLYMHLQFVTDEAVARIHKDWKANIKSFDEGKAHILHLSDALSDGIVKQFPEKF
ncbi:glycosyltransferase [Rossellomorea sp. SC111]|uniref:glycosyltransferase n=1 Tax=Rossellomorea sp. SC111 TaxID=2968985 RepID=UPI00215A46F2|nr:glycosyltransferase [Rossellomorea sp. SC111]MCR8847506.1 glycosyltransferase [Rossellomorea sp. SC111]